MPPGSNPLPRVAIVGASSLRGKELKLVLEERNFPAEIILLDEPDMAGTLTEAAGEPTFIRALEEDSFEGSRFAFFAGSAADAGRNISVAVSSGATVIDLSGSASRAGYSTVWIPALAGALAPAGPPNGGSRPQQYSSPQTPVIIASSLAAGLAKFSPRRIVLVLYPPVSEHGQAGVDELESQSASLLSFRGIGKELFDAQVGFNLLAAYGESSRVRLEEMRASVLRETAQILNGRAPLPAIQLVQAPVFYGYTFSAFAEFDGPVPGGDLRAALSAVGGKFPAPGDPAPDNISVAGESEIHFGAIAPDPTLPNSAWLWGAADNLRLAAANAVRIAEELNAN